MGKGASTLLVAVVVAVFGAGCGESDPEPLTKAAFISQGNAICRQATEERDSALRAAAKGLGGSSTTPEGELERFVDEAALPSLQTMTDELGELGPPEKDEEQVEQIIGGFEEAIEEMESDPHKALPGKSSTEVNEQAESYGLEDCKV